MDSMEHAFTDGSVVVITYGVLDSDASQALDLRSFLVPNATVARALAHTFLDVIPDDITGYQDQVNAWAGAVDAPLVITHQDDDTFFFCAVQTGGCFMEPTQDLSAFHRFVQENLA